MFYNVGDNYATVEVYGIKDNIPSLIDPHDIFRTRTIGFDNIHRGIMGAAASPNSAGQFCKFLQRRFPYYDRFAINWIEYPSLTKEPYQTTQNVVYQCVAHVR